MSFSFFVARRYWLSSTKFNTVRLINRFASFVIGVGVCAFFVIQSVFSGLHDFGLSYSSSLDPDLKIRAVNSASFVLADSMVIELQKIEGVVGSAPVFPKKLYCDSSNKTSWFPFWGLTLALISYLLLVIKFLLGE